MLEKQWWRYTMNYNITKIWSALQNKSNLRLKHEYSSPGPTWQVDFNQKCTGTMHCCNLPKRSPKKRLSYLQGYIMGVYDKLTWNTRLLHTQALFRSCREQGKYVTWSWMMLTNTRPLRRHIVGQMPSLCPTVIITWATDTAMMSNYYHDMGDTSYLVLRCLKRSIT